MLAQYDIRPEPSDANFVLAEGPPDLRDRLLTSGVVVRDCTSFGLPRHVRIAVPDAGGVDAVGRGPRASDWHDRARAASRFW